MLQSSAADDEERVLAEGVAGVQLNALLLHRAIHSNDLKGALMYAALMLSELRTSLLSPQKYYELYMRAFDQLRELEIFFHSEVQRGTCSIIHLYEIVQHAGNVLPRLYLLCTVGSVYIKLKDAPAKDVLMDLVEMCHCIQNPLRGLFLRSYLSQISRDKLTDVSRNNEGDAGNANDAVDFVLQNFIEMTKLWARMKAQEHNLESQKREKERNELRELVGKNLHILSQINGVDLGMYKEVVLPKVLEQVVNCKDELAQYYLMDCLVQVFPDDYHLQTLETLLPVFPQLQTNVDTKAILSQLMERLSNYATSYEEALPKFFQVDAFAKFCNVIVNVMEAQPDMPIVGAISLYVSLLTFTLRIHLDRRDYIDLVLGLCAEKLSGNVNHEDRGATRQVLALLRAPLEKYSDIVKALELPNYPRLMDHLDNASAKEMAIVIIQSIMENRTFISTSEKVDSLFELIKGLIKDMDGGQDEELDEDDFKEEQNLVARLIHMLHNDDPQEMYKIICAVQKHVLSGGTKRLAFTVPPLVFSALKLVRRLQSQEGDTNVNSVSSSLQNIFQLLHKSIEALASVPSPEQALRLYLQCAEAANDCGLEIVAYEFFVQAFILYEEEIADSRAQVTSIHLLIGTLQRMHVFTVDNRDALTHKATGYSAKLLKKLDQCRAVYACSHLFWNDDIKDGERVQLCLSRALRIANAAQQMSSVAGSSGSETLFVEILNKYLYYFESGNTHITSSDVQRMIELARTTMQDNTSPDTSVETFFSNTMKYIEYVKQSGGEGRSEKYKMIRTA